MSPTLSLRPSPEDIPSTPPVRGPVSTPATLIYARHFGLAEKPFSLLPDPSFMFWSPVHSRAYTMLDYGLTTFAPITVITGEVGAGKTTLIRHLLGSVGSELRIGLISNAQGDRGKLLHWIMSAFGQPVASWVPYVERFEKFEAYLRRENQSGRRTVLIVDEAQNLPRLMLEELRCLSNLNVEGSELLQIILVGQPELNDVINRPEMLQFSQRVAAYFHLTEMSSEAVQGYISHRLAKAGANHEIFTPEACARVAEASGGLPRIINQICDYALVHAFAENRSTVGPDIVAQVVDDRRMRFMRRPADRAA